LVATADINLPVSLTNLLWSQLDEWRAADKNKTAVSIRLGSSQLVQHAQLAFYKQLPVSNTAAASAYCKMRAAPKLNIWFYCHAGEAGEHQHVLRCAVPVQLDLVHWRHLRPAIVSQV
jgi:hypothetical protein